MKEELLAAAIRAMKNAYAPYSNYPVGAAVMSSLGVIYSGCNVENEVYPLGQCAERVAIQTMVASGETRFDALLLVTKNGGTPCGACRQVMAEFAAPSAVVFVAREDGIVREYTLGELLPDAFNLE